MANPVVTLAQPTTYSQMLNYLLPTKQAGSTTYVPRITQNVGGTLTDQNSAAGLNDFDHWHNGNHTHIGLDLTYGQLNTATGDVGYLSTTNAANSLVSVGAPVGGRVVVLNDAYNTVQIISPSGMVFEVLHMANVDTSLNGLIVQPGTHLGTMSGEGAGGVRHVHLAVFQTEKLNVSGVPESIRIYYDPKEVMALGDQGRYVFAFAKDLVPEQAVVTTTASNSFQAADSNTLGTGQTQVTLTRTLALTSAGDSVTMSAAGQSVTASYNIAGKRTGGDQFVRDNLAGPASQTGNWLADAQSRQDQIVQSALTIILPNESFRAAIYDDGTGIPTVGYGYALIDKTSAGSYRVKPESEVRASLRAAGVSEVDIAKISFKKLDAIADDLSSKDIASAKQGIADVNSGAIFADESQARRQVTNRLAGEVSGLVNALGGTDVAITQNANQMASLLSLYDNSPALIGPNVRAAVQRGNTDAVVYEIKVNSNKAGLPGLDTRRVQEAALYTNEANVISVPTGIVLPGNYTSIPLPQVYSLKQEADGDTTFFWTQKADAGYGYLRTGDEVSMTFLGGDTTRPMSQTITRHDGKVTEMFSWEKDAKTGALTISISKWNEFDLLYQGQWQGGHLVGNSYIDDGVRFTKQQNNGQISWVDANGLTASERDQQAFDQEVQRMLGRGVASDNAIQASGDLDATFAVFLKAFQAPPKVSFVDGVLLAANEEGYWTDGGFIRTGVNFRLGVDTISIEGAAADQLLDGLSPDLIAANSWAPPQLNVTELGNGLTQRTIELGNRTTLSSIRNEDRLLISTTETERPEASNPNIQTFTTRNAAGAVTGTSTIAQMRDEENNPIPNTYSILNQDAVGAMLSSGIKTVNPVDGSFTTALATPRSGASYSATNAQGITIPTLSPEAQQNLATSASSFNDAYSLIKAYQNNQPLPALASSLRLYNDVSSTKLPPQLTALASGIGALNSLYSFNAALERGDYAQAVVSGASTFNLGVSAYASIEYPGLAAAEALKELGSIGAAAEIISRDLPFLNIANDLIQGNPAAAVGDSVGLYISLLTDLGPAAGPLGAVAGLVIGSILSDIFGDDSPPAPWGAAAAHWNQSTGNFSISVNGVSGGDTEANNQLAALVGDVRFLAEQHNAADLNNPIGLIPQRLGTLQYGFNTDSSSINSAVFTYKVSTFESTTGRQINPNLQFGLNGQVVNAYTGNPIYFQSLSQYYVNNALARQAIAPAWEVLTARLQDANGLSNAGLSEIERATRLGRTAAAIPVNATVEDWNPIGLDFGGNLSTTALAASDVQFNVDGTANLDARLNGTTATQYLHKTDWLNGADGYLVLDKNINGTLDNAEELFSNSAVSEASRGLGSLATWDADGNGVINASDPLYNQLHVWKDSNGDGRVEFDLGEYHSLAELGIASLDYVNGTYTQADGGLHQMATLTLHAQAVGNSYVPKLDGIQVASTNGQVSLYVTRLHDLSAPPAPAPAPAPGSPPPPPAPPPAYLQPIGEEFSVDENVTAIIAVHGNGNTVQGLLDNDHVINAPGAAIYLTQFANAQNGQLGYDGTSVYFTPNTNFYGTAGFDYLVDAGPYGAAWEHVQVDVNHINQAPYIYGIQNPQIPIYGYSFVVDDAENFYPTPVYYPGYAFGGKTPDTEYRYRDQPVDYEPVRTSGDILAYDPDGDPLSWSIVAAPHHGAASVDGYGHWAFTNGEAIGGTDTFLVQTTDPSGLASQIVVTVPLPADTQSYDVFGVGPDIGAPVILDLNQSGFHFTSLNNSSAFFETAADGLRHQTAWFEGGNGVLAFDKYGDGIVHDSSQIAFKDYLPGAQTDLQGLAAFDSNHDGVISHLDARWSQLGVWVDANKDGLDQGSEYQSLQALGIESISLSSDNQFSVDHSVIIHGLASFTRTNGTTSQVADVSLPIGGNVLASNADGSARITTVAMANPRVPIAGGEGNHLILGNKGDNTITAGNGNNVVSSGSGNDLIYVGNGNNSIYSGDGQDMIVAGDGNNIVFLQGGPKLVVAGKGNNLIVGGSGNNVIMAGAGNNTVYGGRGNSVIYAGNGDNTLIGGVGRNELIAGDGRNVLLDGGGQADMYAGTGSNTFEVHNILDTVTAKAGSGINTVKSSVDWTLGANQQILWGTGTAAVTLKGNDLGDQIIGNGYADHLIGGTGNDALADSGGASIMAGSAGDDTYVVTNAATTVSEIAGQGYDTIKTSVSYSLPAHVEKLIATGNAALVLTGNDEGITLVANNGGDTLIGGTGNDTLEGGAAADTLRGGAGDDTYILQRGGGRDTVIDSGGTSDSVLVRGSLTTADITITRSDLDVVVGIKNTQDALVLKNWFSDTLGQESSGQIEAIRFEGGTPAISGAYIHALLDNHALVLTNDSATITAASTPASTVTGNVLVNDSDADIAYDSRQHLSVTNPGIYSGTYGSLSLASNGSYSYALNSGAANVLALGRNTVVNDVFSYAAQDNALDNKTAQALLTVGIKGANEAPQALTDNASVAQNGITSAQGNVLTNDTDVDVGDTLTVAAPSQLHGVYGGLSLAANGQYTYALNSAGANVQALGRNAVVTDTFAYSVTDGLASSTSSLAVHVAGGNDAPLVTADVAFAGEDAVLVTTGNVLSNDRDPDTGDILQVDSSSAGTFHGVYGDLSLTADGSYTYSLNNNASNVQSLRRGQQVTDSFTYSATDGLATAASSLTVTITGSDDAPILTADVASVREDQTLTASSNVLANDHDPDTGDMLRVAAASTGTFHGVYGDLSLAADGSYAYALNYSATNVQALGRNTVVTDTFVYTAQDNSASPLQTSSTLKVTIGGTNDGPTTALDAAVVVEDGTVTATGNVLANDSDIDVGDVLQVESSSVGIFHGVYGDLRLTPDGSYTYSLNNNALNVQSLRDGQKVRDAFTYSATDGLATAASSLTVTVTGTNDAPIAIADVASVKEDQTLTASGNLLANDYDPDTGDSLHVAASCTGTVHGIYGDLSLAADGSYTYALNNGAANVQALGRNASATDTFAYTVQDNGVNPLQTSSTVKVTIGGTNDGPSAALDAAAVTEDGTTTAAGNVLANDSDIDVGDTLAAAVPGLFHGVYGDLRLTADGSYTYSLNNSASNVQSLRDGQQVTDSFAYSATDGVATMTSSLTATITGTNDAPIAVADVASVKEDQTLTASGNVLSNDHDPDTGDTLHVAAASTGTLHGIYGNLSLAADGSYTYALDNSAADVQALGRNAIVTDTFTYGAQDNGNTPLQASSQLTVAIQGSNDGPAALADSAAVTEDAMQAASGNVLGNDSDPDTGDVLSVANPGTLHGSYGDLALGANGSFTYTLNNSALNVQSLAAGQQVTESFAYSATDGLATSASSLSVTVTGTNDAPLTVADVANVKEDAILTATGDVLANDSDVDQGSILRVASPGALIGQFGTLSLAANGAYAYTLNNSALSVQSLREGQQVTDTFAYSASDGLAATASTLSVTITGSNDAPVTTADTASVKEDAILTATGNVLLNDNDPDTGDTLHVAANSTGTRQGSYGSLSLAADGSYSYVLNNTAANVQALGRNAFVADTFAYTAQDNSAIPLQASSTLTVTIAGTNDGPQVVMDVASVTEDSNTSASGNVLANDSDIDLGDTLSILSPGILRGTYGDLSLAASGGYTYTLNNVAANVQSLRGGQQVSDNFAYSVTDGLATATSRLTVTITGANDAPIAVGDTTSVKEDQTLTASSNVLANDHDPDTGDSLHVAAASTGTVYGIYGNLSLAADGSYTYALNNGAANVQALGRNAAVTDTFAYTAQDNGINPLQVASTLTVTINGTNDGPQAVVDIAAVSEDGTLTASGNVLTNDRDIDTGDTLAVAAFGILHGSYGDLNLAANGSYTYTLNNTASNVQSLRGSQIANDSFTYSATDGLATSASMLTVAVTGANDAPLAVADTAFVKEDVTLTASGNVLTNDTDPDQATVLSVGNPRIVTGQFGTLTLNFNGSYGYVLNNTAQAVQRLGAGQTATDVFSYAVKDDDTNPLSASANLSITIAGTNDAPVEAIPVGTQVARENQAFAFTVPSTTFTDADSGDLLTYSAKAVDAQGNLQALPVWLTFNAATRSFTGNPGSTAGGSFDLAVTAVDLSGAATSSCFTLNVSDEFAGTGASANLITGNNAGNLLNGTSLNEIITGKAGADILYGGAGDDTLDGGAGADFLYGDAGNDILKFGDDAVWGSKTVAVNAGSPGTPGSGQSYELKDMSRSLDTFDGGTGIDTLLGTSGNDVIALDDGSQRIKNIEIIDAGAGDDLVDLTSRNYAMGDVTVYGGTGNDVIWTSSGNDILDGGAGADVMAGGKGDDTYIVDNARDAVQENANEGNDTVKASISYTLGANVENLVLTGTAAINGTGHSLNNHLTGNSAANTLTGGTGDDVLDGAGGNDILIGGKGSDTYVFGRGYGADTIQENDSTAGNSDLLQFTGGIAVDQLWLRKVSNNLEVSIIGTADKMTISNWYLGSQYHVEALQTSDGRTLLDSQVQNLVQAMASFAPPPMGQTSLAQSTANSLSTVLAANWR